MLTRDHARSDKIESVFSTVQINMPGSRATEQLFREVLSRSPHRKIKGLACYYLARFLDYQASFVRGEKLIDLAQKEDFGSPIQEASWGKDYHERLRNMDAEAIERESIRLYERMGEEFGDLPLPHPLPRLTGDLAFRDVPPLSRPRPGIISTNSKTWALVGHRPKSKVLTWMDDP